MKQVTICETEAQIADHKAAHQYAESVGMQLVGNHGTGNALAQETACLCAGEYIVQSKTSERTFCSCKNVQEIKNFIATMVEVYNQNPKNFYLVDLRLTEAARSLSKVAAQ